jgi:hypothetical protein
MEKTLIECGTQEIRNGAEGALLLSDLNLELWNGGKRSRAVIRPVIEPSVPDFLSSTFNPVFGHPQISLQSNERVGTTSTPHDDAPRSRCPTHVGGKLCR